MRLKVLSVSIALLCSASCAEADESSAGFIPKPAPQPIEVVSGEKGENWRKIAPENLLFITTKYGEIVVELNPEFAPGHVERMRELASKRALNGAEFYRVIDGFVAQGGLNLDKDNMKSLEIEVEQNINESDRFQPLENDDLFAPEVGFEKGFAVGRNSDTGKKWLLHCPGAIAMARSSDPNTGNADFYIVLDAQRYLDRNLTVFGRVISGMQYVQKLKRGDRDIAGGVIQAPAKGDQMFSVKLATDIPEEERSNYEVMKSNTSAFQNEINSQRVRRGEFFFNTPPQIVDICDVDVPVEKID
jgi:peptidylprolyl isomerase